MAAVLSPEISDRSEFSLLCNWRKLYRAVEVGVDRGVFSEEFMSRWRGHNYFGIDTYAEYPEFPWSRETDYLMAVARYERSKINCKLVKAESAEAAESIKQYSGGYFAEIRLIDFIYIDAAHTYESVKSDLESWWPLVSAGGILAGHDYSDLFPEVIQAVDEFFADKGTVYITRDSPASWYVYRNGIPGPDWSRI
jgi:hypothetical protein